MLGGQRSKGVQPLWPLRLTVGHCSEISDGGLGRPGAGWPLSCAPYDGILKAKLSDMKRGRRPIHTEAILHDSYILMLPRSVVYLLHFTVLSYEELGTHCPDRIGTFGPSFSLCSPRFPPSSWLHFLLSASPVRGGPPYRRTVRFTAWPTFPTMALS